VTGRRGAGRVGRREFGRVRRHRAGRGRGGGGGRVRRLAPRIAPPPAAEGGVGGGDGPPSRPRRIGVSVALNEDLTCEYRGSRLSSLSVEGTVQVRVSGTSSSDDDDGGEEQGGQDGGASRPGPFGLLFRDPSGHIRALQENKKYVSGSPGGPTDVPGRVFAYSVDVPRGGEYFPVVRYKCSSSLRPRPGGRPGGDPPVQPGRGGLGRRVADRPLARERPRTGGEVPAPERLRGRRGGYGDEDEGAGADAAGLEFPVLARCQCQGAQLSDVDVDAAPSPLFPAEVSRDLVRRFRVSHRETQADTA
ncbi:hypothetical protein THAOC_19035, partial [Thalassiosira oceanica]